ncbi:MAG: hypothetical protein CVV30_01450 [Methanomicrobiales archaeon HGW-Methanomicrobiales-1]|jgi:hypothetical protein|nr:MAG: hypothetical protein CVV30_01450 [Methanomicrobiales archaeon HGW-Methanomicrobiales-1]
MNTRTILLTLIVAACCLLVVQPIQALTGDDQTSVYQTTFGSNPNWITNTGGPSSNYYWDSGMAMYHFSIEPSSGSFAYIPVDFDDGSFTLDYDLILTRIDDGATFRMGLSGSEMDPSKGPNVISMFTNAKYGQIMWLHLVSTGNKLVEVNSQSAATEMGTDAYKGPTAKYEINKTYHVTVNYNDDSKVLSMKVRELQSGNDIWSYFIQCGENIRGLNRIYMGAKGDYGMQNIYAQGYIDNVRLTIPSTGPAVSETPVVAVPVTTAPAPVTTTKKPTPKITVPTPYPTETPQSPSSGILPVVALGIAGAVCCIGAIRKN